MALLQISEPGMSTTAHQHRLAAGIDLGTTNSLVASVRSGQADTFPDDQGRHLLPSVVRYQADAVPVVGYDAKAAITTDPLNTIASAKRLMGRGVGDIKQLGGICRMSLLWAILLCRVLQLLRVSCLRLRCPLTSCGC